jgi:hypothetical protein
MSPFSLSTISALTRREANPYWYALRHSSTNCRLGALPTTVDRMLALPSTTRSSQSA